MKRLAAIAVIVAMSALPACAQHGGGSHGGFSGSHAGGGFSAPRGGFSGGHVGFSAPRGSSFHGGSGSFVRSGPPRFAGSPIIFNPRPPSVRPPARFGGPVQGPVVRPPQYVSNRMPYPGRGVRPAAPISSLPRQPNPGTSHRIPYHSPYGGDHRDGWDHHGGDHGRHHGGHHHSYGFYGYYGWAGYPYAYGWAGYPYWPWWGWSYPILPASWDYWDGYDSQPASNYPASQYPEYMPGPHDTYPSDQPEPEQPGYTPWPYSRPAPSAAEPAPAAPALPGASVTLVFKDGRPNEQISNYVLTSKTLSVFDLPRRDIPVNQIDLGATARVNREAGVEFALPARPN